MKTMMFRALVTWEAAFRPPGGEPGALREVELRAGGTAGRVLVATEDGEPFRAGEVEREATLTVTDEALEAALATGTRFELRHDGPVGVGVVVRRVYV